ncbi:MAG: hypothetical protein RLW87_07050 [Alphaproteobacteria bacterium]|jgi:hypothetical protein
MSEQEPDAPKYDPSSTNRELNSPEYDWKPQPYGVQCRTVSHVQISVWADASNGRVEVRLTQGTGIEDRLEVVSGLHPAAARHLAAKLLENAAWAERHPLRAPPDGWPKRVTRR